MLLLNKKMYDNFSTDEDTDEEVEVKEEKVKINPFEVEVYKTNKEEIWQPSCCDCELLPKLPTTMLVIGRSGSGKTNAVVNLLQKENLLKDTFDYIYLFSGIKPDEELLKPLNIPKSQTFIDFLEEDVKKIMTKMENTVESIGMKKTPSVLFLFDDILGKPKFLRSETMSKLVTTNRHMNITCIILSQYFKKLPPVVRTNASYYMIFPSSMSELEKIADELTPPNKSKKEFIKLLQYATNEKYNFFSLNSKTSADKMCRKNFAQIINI
jgi:hypothetical protein